jgi:curved DNA-binding protein CbpA
LKRYNFESHFGAVKMIFLCYRREDSAGHAGRLFDRLSARFGGDRVFMDVSTIEPGEDFVDAIQRTVGACDVQLVLIGRRWLTVTDEYRRPRLENPEDFVRLEISAALERQIRVIPVLVGRAAMPQSSELPQPLAPLTRRSAFELSDAAFHNDADRLIAAIDKVLSSTKEASRQNERIASERVEKLAAARGAAGERVRGTPSEPAGQRDLGEDANGDYSVELTLTFDEALVGAQKTVIVSGRKMKLNVPAGIDTGMRMRLQGEAPTRDKSGRLRDLYVLAVVSPHPMYQRDEKDLYCTVRLTDTALRNGSTVRLPALAGREIKVVEIPAGTEPGTRLKVAKGGVLDISQNKPAGDMYVTIEREREED